MLTVDTVKKILKAGRLAVPPATLRGALAKATKTNRSLEEVLVTDGVIDEAAFYDKAAHFFGVPLANLKGREIKKEILNLIPGPVAGTHQVVAFEKEKNEVKIAMADPTDLQTIEFLRRRAGSDIAVYLATPTDLKEALRRYHAELEDDLKIIQDGSGDVATGDLKKAAEEMPIINVVNSVLEHGVYEGASDIHVEPAEKEIIIRYRIDGILKPVMTLPKAIQNGITARIKILANLKLDEHMIPQDGRFKIQVQEEKLAFRVSILPVYDGEKIVMRLLHEGAKPLSLEQLGLLPEARAKMDIAIKKPHGMILVTGPTGSGKTTTLYSVLGVLNQPGVNISTVEDPIEYRINGVNQSQINPKVGFTFASGLRALLRQDPNIIMVGEIRDQETAEISINASMTGHLVLSTLHTNDAPTTLPRLIDMGVPPFLIAYTANLIVAQRLVRKICPHCTQTYKLEKEALKDLESLCDVNKLTALFKAHVPKTPESKNTDTLTFHRGAGCRRCADTGYKGRVGIYEVLEVSDMVRQKINAHGTADDIKHIAQQEGMLTMLQDGLIKAKMGVTTINEVVRVTKE